MAPHAETRRPAFSSIPPEDWRNVLAEANCERDVISIVRDYLAVWAPEELGRLPFECRPGRMKDGEDVVQWAYQLASNHCSDVQSDADPMVTRMLVFATQAGMRLSQLKAAPPPQ